MLVCLCSHRHCRGGGSCRGVSSEVLPGVDKLAHARAAVPDHPHYRGHDNIHDDMIMYVIHTWSILIIVMNRWEIMHIWMIIVHTCMINHLFIAMINFDHVWICWSLHHIVTPSLGGIPSNCPSWLTSPYLALKKVHQQFCKVFLLTGKSES